MRTQKVTSSKGNAHRVLKPVIQRKKQPVKKTHEKTSVEAERMITQGLSRPVICDVLGEPSVTDLAQLYCAWPESALHREDMFEAARVQLSKYDLEPEELNRIAPVLARTLHMLVEQNGAKPLAEGRELEIEKQVLEWCGCKNP